MDPIQEELEKMVGDGKIKKKRTFIVRYNGKNLITRSGKRAWAAQGHAKLAVQHHFSSMRYNYMYFDDNGQYGNFSNDEAVKRMDDFNARLWSLVEIVEI